MTAPPPHRSADLLQLLSPADLARARAAGAAGRLVVPPVVFTRAVRLLDRTEELVTVEAVR